MRNTTAASRAVLAIAWLLTQARAQQPPAVLALEPPHLATGVDNTKVSRIVVRFDVDMDAQANVLCGVGASFPKVTGTQWLDARTFAVDVELEAGRVYAMDLGSAGTTDFRSRSGTWLATTSWCIATRGEPLADGKAAVAAERLFAAVRDHYAYRDRVGVDWGEIEHRHHEHLAAASDGATFALLASEVLANAQDPYVTVRWQDGVLPTFRRRATANFDLRGLQRTLPRLAHVGRTALSARTADGIGYLSVPTFARDSRDEFDLVLQALRDLRDCKAIVLDVRMNSGGDEAFAQRLAAFFVAGEVVYAKQRMRDPKAEGGFRAVESRRLRGNSAPDVFERPVAVLMGPLAMSSCEAFLLMMKQAPQAVLVGDDSYGSSGNPQPHTLLPGLVVHLPACQALRPDGSPIEGEGVAPHLHVHARAGDFVGGDPVLQAALVRLRGQR